MVSVNSPCLEADPYNFTQLRSHYDVLITKDSVQVLGYFMELSIVALRPEHHNTQISKLNMVGYAMSLQSQPPVPKCASQM